jgi:hypothetical protein
MSDMVMELCSKDDGVVTVTSPNTVGRLIASPHATAVEVEVQGSYLLLTYRIEQEYSTEFHVSYINHHGFEVLHRKEVCDPP